ncbi:unnamed protein product [Durusdinium trenchii]|uniref:Uncharacterized protein n=2 Tax=Durusdinium trenchii TaxID=1381693 RepID=A0ABP0I7I2_9DINO
MKQDITTLLWGPRHLGLFSLRLGRCAGGMHDRLTEQMQSSTQDDRGVEPRSVPLKEKLLNQVRQRRDSKLGELTAPVVPGGTEPRPPLKLPIDRLQAAPTAPVLALDVSAPAVPSVDVAAPLPTGLPVVSSGPGWSEEDERQQQEAIRTIQMLRRRQSQEPSDGRMKDHLEAHVSAERSRKEAAQQQVLCLEYELDGKEAALQMAEKHLDQRDAELLEVKQQLELLRAGDAAAEDAARIRSLRNELDEKERQLELKENHIQQLLASLQQHGNSLVGEGARLGATVSPTHHFR